jgi:hypothetical protein
MTVSNSEEPALCQSGVQRFLFWMCNFKTSGRGRMTRAGTSSLTTLVAEWKAIPLLEARERAGGGDVESIRCAMLRSAKVPERLTAVRQRRGKFGAVANFRIRV